jgi:2-oxo-4-hydroxy-4-carboxy-5-ureidoimidazoline decarboxylase
MTEPVGPQATVERWNRADREELIATFLSACHSARFAEGVTDGRPFRDPDHVVQLADDVWLRLDPADWLEALRGHPRIGENGGTSQEFSRTEQAGMDDADAAIRAAIAAGNQEYEDHFGHVFLIAAAGRTPQDILDNLRGRLNNSAEREIVEAAEQHRRITELRLRRLLSTTS